MNLGLCAMSLFFIPCLRFSLLPYGILQYLLFSEKQKPALGRLWCSVNITHIVDHMNLPTDIRNIFSSLRKQTYLVVCHVDVTCALSLLVSQIDPPSMIILSCMQSLNCSPLGGLTHFFHTQTHPESLAQQTLSLNNDTPPFTIILLVCFELIWRVSHGKYSCYIAT